MEAYRTLFTTVCINVVPATVSLKEVRPMAYLVNTFGLFKAVSDTILYMIVTTYHHKPLRFSGATFRGTERNFGATNDRN